MQRARARRDDHRREHAGPTVLRLSPNCVYDIITPASAADGLPVITGNVTLVGGPSTTIRRSPTAAAPFRILEVAAAGTLRVVGISILNGSIAGLGGGILVNGTLVLNRTTLAGNTAGNGGAVAISAGAHADISRTVISYNSTTGVGGGGIINLGDLAVFLTRITGNNAPVNGGESTPSRPAPPASRRARSTTIRRAASEAASRTSVRRSSSARW